MAMEAIKRNWLVRKILGTEPWRFARGQAVCAQCFAALCAVNLTRSHDFRVTVKTLQQDACLICAAVWNQFDRRRTFVPDYFNDSEMPAEMRVDRIEERLLLTILLYAKTNAVPVNFAITQSETGNITWNKSPSTQTLSSNALHFMKAKYDECLASHPQCKLQYQDKRHFNPTRLLNVAGSDSSKVYLMNTADSFKEKYASLSHCWGTYQPTKLTRKTAGLLEQGLKIELLPQTFQDAVSLCRRLSIDFIWIDSLCIYQDDLSDWDSEAAMMCDVYRHAVCNLAATGAADGSVGMNFQRDVTHLLPIEIQLPRSSWTESAEDLDCTNWVFIPTAKYKQHISDSPLLDRAWVLQERYASRRIIHCTSQGVYWECFEDSSSEMFPDSQPDKYRSIDEELKRLLLRMRSSGSEHEGWTMDLYAEWEKLKMDYSHRKLTVESDRLVAIQALVSDIVSVTGDVLVCGLWQSMLLYELNWVCLTLPRKRPAEDGAGEEWLAPSWSWASARAPTTNVGHPHCPRRRERATVEKFDMDAFPSGRLKHGSLSLRCRPVHAKLTVNEDMSKELVYESDTSIPFWRKNYGQPVIDPVIDLDDPHSCISHTQRVVCLALYDDYCSTITCEPEFSYAHITILVLQPVATKDTPVAYKRIGMVYLSDQYDKENTNCSLYTKHEEDEQVLLII